MKRKYLLIFSLLVTACAPSVAGSSSYNEDNSSNISSESSKDSSSSSKGRPISISFGSSSNSKHSSSSFEDVETFSFNETKNLISSANAHDNELSEVYIAAYDIQLENYIKINQTETKYNNDVTYIIGKKTFTDFFTGEKNEGEFVNQIAYRNNELSQIIKYSSYFSNTANKVTCDANKAATQLSIGQSSYAYKYFVGMQYEENLLLKSVETDDGYYIAAMFYEELRDDGYAYAGGFELSMDKKYYITDFFYSEGVYDWLYLDDVPTMRKHGPAPYGEGGIIYEATNFKYNQNKTYSDNLVFPIEENFVKNVSFKQESLTVSRKDARIDLYDYVVTDPVGGEFTGCPYSNLVFTLDDKTVARIDSHYVYLTATGTTYISVKDNVTGATSPIKLELTIID